MAANSGFCTPQRDIEVGRRTHLPISPEYNAPAAKPPITPNKRRISVTAAVSAQKKAMNVRSKQPQTTVTDIVDRVPRLEEIGPGVLICYYMASGLTVIDSIVNNLERIAHDTVLASSPLYLMLRRCQEWLPDATAGWTEVAAKLNEMRPGLGQYTMQIVEPKASWWNWRGPAEDIGEAARLGEFLDEIDKELQLLRLKHDALERQVVIPCSPPSCDAACIKPE